jgi:hypothetical protein
VKLTARSILMSSDSVLGLSSVGYRSSASK